MQQQSFLAAALVSLMIIPLTPATVSAADYYVGASVGQSRVHGSAADINAGFLADDGFVASATSLDKTDTGWKAYGGVQFLRLFAVEGGYTDLGRATFDTTIVDAPPPADALTPFPIHATATATGFHLAGMVRVPLMPLFDVFAKAGLFRWHAKFAEQIPGAGVTRVSRTEDQTDPLYGVGAQMNLPGGIAGRLEWERFQNVGEGIGGRGGQDIDFWSVGVNFAF